MADLQPFRAIHFDPRSIRLAEVLAPPYDVISPAERDALRQRSPHNIIHLILGQNHIGSGVQEGSTYASAGSKWRQWRDEGAVIPEPSPNFYVYEQRFHYDGDNYTRTGLVAAVRLEPYSNEVIFPHEKTFEGPKEDRLHLMEAVNANLDSVFGLYDGPSVGIEALLKRASEGTPLLSGTSPDGQEHRVWAIGSEEDVAAIHQAFTNASIVIADGHHRYETALNYRNRRRSAGDVSPELDSVMMTLVSTDDPGLLVLPTHRMFDGTGSGASSRLPGPEMAREVTQALSGAFNVESTGTALHTLNRLERLDRDGTGALGLYFGEDEGYVLTPHIADAHRYESVARFPEEALKRLKSVLDVSDFRVGYTHSGADAVCQINAGEFWVAILLQGLPVSEVYEAARAGHLMPEKSTFFYPKLQSGLLMRPLEALP